MVGAEQILYSLSACNNSVINVFELSGLVLALAITGILIKQIDQLIISLISLFSFVEKKSSGRFRYCIQIL
jgi:hypothetical protein